MCVYRVCSLVLEWALGWLVISPLLTLSLGMLSRRLLLQMHDDLSHSQNSFQHFHAAGLCRIYISLRVGRYSFSAWDY
jgi:hypothetical protein